MSVFMINPCVDSIAAAHCVVDQNIPSLRVVGGEHSLVAPEATEQTRRVMRKIVHESYDSETYQNDIALLELDVPLQLNDAVASINLPDGNYDGTGKASLLSSVTISCPPWPHKCVGVGVVSGWGRTAVDGDAATILRKVSVPLIADDKCREYYGTSVIIDSMLCAGEFRQFKQCHVSSRMSRIWENCRFRRGRKG